MVYLIHFSKSFREEQTDQTIMHKAVVREGREGEIKVEKTHCLFHVFQGLFHTVVFILPVIFPVH